MVGGNSPKCCPSTRSVPEASSVTRWLVADAGDGAHGTSRNRKLPAAYGAGGLMVTVSPGMPVGISNTSGIVGYVFGVSARYPPVKFSRPLPLSVVHGLVVPLGRKPMSPARLVVAPNPYATIIPLNPAGSMIGVGRSR